MDRIMKVVRPKTIDTVITNPGIGFNTFMRFNGDPLNEGKTWTEGFPIQYHPYRGNLDVQGYPMTTTAYMRLYWRYLQPEEGQYRWDLIDQALETAMSRHQTLLLRIPPHGMDFSEEDVPDWYREKVGPGKKWLCDKWLVNPEDPLYLRYYGNLIRKLGDRYDGHPALESIDASLIGFWGEGEGSDLLTAATAKALIDTYLDVFQKTPILMMLYDGDTMRYALTKRNVGYRADCLGDMRKGWDHTADFKEFDPGGWSHMLDLYPRQIIESGMAEAWKKAPVSFEVCWVMQHWLDEGWDIDYIIEQSLKWHISTFNPKSSPVPEIWKDKVDGWLKRMGYRLALRRFTWPASIQAGDRLFYTCWIENAGVAPCYKNFQFAFRLKNDRFSVVFLTEADIRTWLPGDSLWDNSFLLPSNMPIGQYDLQTAILDRQFGKPAVRFAMEGLQTDGWYTLGNLQIEASNEHIEWDKK